MFDFDAGKLLIVGVIALIFIPPKDLPRVLRQVGQFVGKMRRMAADFRGQFMEAMREADMADLRKEAQKLADAARVETGLESVHDLGRHMTSVVAAPHVAQTSTPISADANDGDTRDGMSVAERPDVDRRAFEDLKSELRPLADEARETARTEHTAGQPHSA